MSEEYQTRAQLEELHHLVVADCAYRCPLCRAAQDNNGLIAWCENGHVYKVVETDPRYSLK